MKKDKGFTLVELIAVIVLLAIVATIAIVSISSVKGKVDERQYKSLATTITAAAEKYAADTGVTKMFVQTLIDKGLVQTDDESKQIYDPRSNSSMNCRTIELDENNNFVLSETGENCNIELLKDQVFKIKYCEAGKNGVCEYQEINDNTWFHEPIDLYVRPSDIGENLTIDLEKAEYTWISPLAPDKVGKDKIYNVNSNYVDDEYQVTVTSGGRDYIATQRIKMDQTSPRVYDFALTDPGSWKVIKKVTFKISDYESGLASYALSTSNTIKPADSDWKTDGINKAGDNTAVITTDYNFSGMGEENVKLYVWVKDVAGNTNEDDLRNGTGSGVGIDIGNLDTKIDSLTISKNTDEYVQSVTLTGTAEDEKSGIVGYQFTQTNCKKDDGKLIDDAIITGSWTNIAKTNSITQTKSGVSTPGDWYFWVKDDADNVRCEKVSVDNIDVNIDNISMKIVSDANVWETQQTIQGSALDTKSGLIAYLFTQNSSTTAPSSGWSSITPKTTSQYTTPNKVVTSRGTWYFWVKDNAGNTKRTSINVDKIGTIRTTTEYHKTYSSSSTNDTYTYSNLKRLLSVEIISSPGRITYTMPSSTQIKVNYSGASAKTEPDYYNTDKSPNRTNATLVTTSVCKTPYCDSPGIYDSRTKSCTGPKGSQYQIYSNNSDYLVLNCGNDKIWTPLSVSYANTPCDSGYHRLGGQDYTCEYSNPVAGYRYAISLEKRACLDSEIGMTIHETAHCKATCYLDYMPVKCREYKKEYVCSYGSTLYGSSCYSCPSKSGCSSNGFKTSNMMCSYTCLMYVNYYDYTIRVTYIGV